MSQTNAAVAVSVSSVMKKPTDIDPRMLPAPKIRFVWITFSKHGGSPDLALYKTSIMPKQENILARMSGNYFCFTGLTNVALQGGWSRDERIFDDVVYEMATALFGALLFPDEYKSDFSDPKANESPRFLKLARMHQAVANTPPCYAVGLTDLR